MADRSSKVPLALIVTTPVQGRGRLIGVARHVKEPQAGDAEFAIVLSDDWHRRGSRLGTRLLVSLISAAKSDGVRRLVGTTLSPRTSAARSTSFDAAAQNTANRASLRRQARWVRKGTGPKQPGATAGSELILSSERLRVSL